MSRTTQYFPFAGGVNTDTPALSMAAGELINSTNYEHAINGGYRRIGGFERFDGRPSPSSLSRTDYDTDALYAAAVEALRTPILAIAGVGDILGVWRYNDTTYAFRNKVGGTEAGMWESTSAGWVEVVTGVTLLADGRYEFINVNFSGHSGSVTMFGVDGKNKGFMYDGTTFTQITTGMTTDTPEHLHKYKNYLWYSFSGGSVQRSSLGVPTTWSALTGAAELGIGDDITGFKDVAGDSFAVFCRNSTHIISGTPETTAFNVSTYSETSGALEWTIQRLAYPVYLDDNGVLEFRSVQSYGDFQAATLSQKITKRLSPITNLATASMVVRKKNQFRLYFSNGTGFIFTFSGTKLSGIMPVNYGKTVKCCCNSSDSDGTEVLFFGSDNGFIYQLDSGNSFDGEEVVAWMRPSFHHFKSPENTKRFFKIVLEIDADESANLAFLPVFDYGDSLQPNAIEGEISVTGAGGAWDEDNWDSFFYDSAIISSAYGYLDAVGKNFSLLIRSNLTYEEPHTIQGAIVHYSQRGLKR